MAVSNTSKFHSQAQRLSSRSNHTRRSAIVWASKLKHKISDLMRSMETLSRGIFSRIKHYSTIVSLKNKIEQLKGQLECWISLTTCNKEAGQC